MLRARDAFFRRALAVSDVLAGYAALVLALLLAPGVSVHPRIPLILLAPGTVLVSKALGLYDRDEHCLRKTTVDQASSVFHLAVCFSLAVWLAESILLDARLSRGRVLVLIVLSFVLMLVCRAVTRGIVLARTTPERCIVVGNAEDCERAAAKLTGSSGVRAVVLGRVALPGAEAGVDHRGERAVSQSPMLGDWRSLARLVRVHAAERVIIAPDGDDQEEILDCIRLVKALGIKVSVLPRLLEVVGSSSTFDDVDGVTLLGVRQYGLSRSSEILKRLMDVALAVVALVLLAPLLAFLAIAIKLDSPGPVLFRQPRVGRRGEHFSMLKFRSMIDGADRVKATMQEQNEAGGGLFKILNDPRITRVGRFLRRTSLDELPQLWNVLRGEMSLVGPRPLEVGEDALIEGWRRRRLAVRPGITGLWQIFGSARIPMQEMVKIDYIYGANWSLWLDLKVLIRTVPYVLRRRGL